MFISWCTYWWVYCSFHDRFPKDEPVLDLSIWRLAEILANSRADDEYKIPNDTIRTKPSYIKHKPNPMLFIRPAG